jgi:hypothetical protein
LDYKWDFAYANEFLVALDELDMDKLKTISLRENRLLVEGITWGRIFSGLGTNISPVCKIRGSDQELR